MIVAAIASETEELRANMMRAGSVVIALVATACSARGPGPEGGKADPVSTQVASLHAFGRLYGVLRWFHPSDAAAAVDWDGFAVNGVRRVVGISDPGKLRAALGELIAPFAPTVEIVSDGSPSRLPIVKTESAA